MGDESVGENRAGGKNRWRCGGRKRTGKMWGWVAKVEEEEECSKNKTGEKRWRCLCEGTGGGNRAVTSVNGSGSLGQQDQHVTFCCVPSTTGRI